MARNQIQDAQDLYDNRASKYDDSWHPRFARHMVELARLRPGESVLDLACGTGLATFLASLTVGAHGTVAAVDISTGMLVEAEAKKKKHALNNVELYQHSITALRTLSALDGRTFDAITCCSALVLLEHPIEALKQWTTYLKPGGRLVVDVTHVQNQLPMLIFERVGRRLGRLVPWYRLNFSTDDSLQKAMEEAGLVNVNVLLLCQRTTDWGPPADHEELADYICDFRNPAVVRVFDVDEVEDVFEEWIERPSLEFLSETPEIRAEAKQMFREEWQAAADTSGKVTDVDGVFAGVGYKPL